MIVVVVVVVVVVFVAVAVVEPLPAANPHGSEGRKSIKIAAKNSPM